MFIYRMSAWLQTFTAAQTHNFCKNREEKSNQVRCLKKRLMERTGVRIR